MKIIEVLIEYSIQSLNRPFSYFYSGSKKIDEGFRVLISFHGKDIVGYVVNVKDTNKSIKEIERITRLLCKPV